VAHRHDDLSDVRVGPHVPVGLGEIDGPVDDGVNPPSARPASTNSTTRRNRCGSVVISNNV
jgi:hypothetical protein